MRMAGEVLACSGRSTLVCVTEAMSVDQRLREGSGWTLTRVPEMRARERGMPEQHYGNPQWPAAYKTKVSSRRRRILFELLKVPTFNLFHESFALEEKLLKPTRELVRHYEKLVVNHFGEGDWTACGNEMHTPLEHQARGPENKEREESGGGRERGPAGVE